MTDWPRLTKKPPKWWIDYVIGQHEEWSVPSKMVADEIKTKWAAFCEVARVWRGR